MIYNTNICQFVYIHVLLGLGEECYYNTNLIFSNDGTLKRAYFKVRCLNINTVNNIRVLYIILKYH